jgi:hypothetical protein
LRFTVGRERAARLVCLELARTKVLPHLHCPRCGHRVTLAPTYWVDRPGLPRMQHVTCPACSAQLVRPVLAWGDPKPWVEEQDRADED